MQVRYKQIFLRKATRSWWYFKNIMTYGSGTVCHSLSLIFRKIQCLSYKVSLDKWFHTSTNLKCKQFFGGCISKHHSKLTYIWMLCSCNKKMHKQTIIHVLQIDAHNWWRVTNFPPKIDLKKRCWYNLESLEMEDAVHLANDDEFRWWP